MSNTGVIYVRIDNSLKNEAEAILADLGVSPSSYIQMAYKQVILHQGLPFDVRKPNTLVYYETMSDDDIADIIKQRLKSYKDDKEYTKEEFHKILTEKYGI